MLANKLLRCCFLKLQKTSSTLAQNESKSLQPTLLVDLCLHIGPHILNWIEIRAVRRPVGERSNHFSRNPFIPCMYGLLGCLLVCGIIVLLQGPTVDTRHLLFRGLLRAFNMSYGQATGKFNNSLAFRWACLGLLAHGLTYQASHISMHRGLQNDLTRKPPPISYTNYPAMLAAPVHPRA